MNQNSSSQPSRQTPTERRKHPRPGRSGQRQQRTVVNWLHLWLQPRWQLPCLLLLTILALLFVWQVRLPQTILVGGPDDQPFLTGFHEPETMQGTDQRFRWTTGQSTISFPGFGAAPADLTLTLQGGRPGNPTPIKAIVSLGDMSGETVAVAPGLQAYQFTVPAAAFRDGTLTVTISSPTYQAPGDRRILGIVVTQATLHDTPGPGGIILPPWQSIGAALLTLLCTYGLVGFALRSWRLAAVAGWLTVCSWAILALQPRATLSLAAPTIALFVALCTLAAVLLLGGLRVLRQRYSWAVSEWVLGGAVLIATLHALTLLLGMRHPQYRSSDLMLNVHRLDYVQNGIWIFTLPLPGPRALEAPYPPLFYAVMLPFSWLIPDKIMLVEVTATLLTVCGTLLTFALARRLTAADPPALLATVVAWALPITYNLASAGNFANLFGQGVATIALVALISTWGHWTSPRIAALLTLLLILALLGHFGVFLSLLVTLPCLIVVAATGGAPGRRQALALLGCFLVALLVSWAIYYRFFGDLLLGHLRDFLGGNTQARGGAVAEATLAQRLRNEFGALLLWWGWPALPLGLAGAALLAVKERTLPVRLTLTWLGTAVLFIVAALVAGLSVRYHLFVAAPLAIAAGWALWSIWRSHRIAGPLISSLLLGFWLWQGLSYWAGNVLHAYH